MRTALWGWRRGWLCYFFTTGEQAQRAGLRAECSRAFDRELVTVLLP